MMLTTQAETEYAKGDGVSIAYQVTGDGPLDLVPGWVSHLEYSREEPSHALASMAAAGEVLVSGTVKDLVAGSGLRFKDVLMPEGPFPASGGSLRSQPMTDAAR